jgi:uncharacterized protein YceK
MKKLTIVLAVVLLAGVAFVASAQGPTKQQELSAAGISNWTPGQTRGNGPVLSKLNNPVTIPQGEFNLTDTLVYDSGAVTALPTTFGAIYGNNFAVDNTGNPLKATVTLNSFSFLFAEDSVADTGLFIFNASNGGTAGVIHSRVSTNIGGLANAGSSFSNPVFNVIPQSALGTTGVFSGNFYLGGWCLNSATTLPIDNETFGLDTVAGAPGLNGFTATSGGATSSVAFSGGLGFNAILRANITGVVPVELMAFDVE